MKYQLMYGNPEDSMTFSYIYVTKSIKKGALKSGENDAFYLFLKRETSGSPKIIVE